jgi:alcohol dehydrogenase YqhD (iron-dependent ADH family)
MMHDFQLYHPTRVLFGEGQQQPFFDRLAILSKNWVVITGGSSVDRNGTYALVESSLSSRGLNVVRFSGVRPNPDVTDVNRAVKLALENGCTGVLALGGGSVMDAAKIAALGIALSDTDLWPVVTLRKRTPATFQMIPLACIPTTAGTASEVTPYAVISNRLERDKRTFSHEWVHPQVSWLNPAFTVGVPPAVTAETSADILSHVLENYVLGGSDAALADAYCEAVMKTVMTNLPLAYEDGADLAARGSLMLASNWALNGFQGLGRRPAPFILHAIEHVMSAWKPELAHGRGLSTLFPAYFHWLLEHHRAETRLSRLSTVFFDMPGATFDARRMVVEFNKWLHRYGLGYSMENLGFTKDMYRPMAEQVFAQFRRSEIDLLGPFTADNVIEIFELTRFQHIG